MACVGKCVWGFITHYIIGTIVRWWVPHKTNSTYGMCKFACSKSYVEMNWWVFFSVCTMRDKLNGRDMNVKSPRTWHNSLLERLYWLVWIMRVWYDSISVSKVIWQLSYVTKLCGTKAQVGKLVFTIAPYTLPRDAWDNQLDPFQPTPGAPHPRKKLTPPPPTH